MQTSKTLEQEHARSEASTWEGILQKETFCKLTEEQEDAFWVNRWDHEHPFPNHRYSSVTLQ